MPIVFLVRPANNAVAIELSGWAATLHNVVSTAAVYISADFASTAASRAAVDNTLPLNDALFFFGHGTLAKLLGATSDLVGSNVPEVAGQRQLHFISCIGERI